MVTEYKRSKIQSFKNNIVSSKAMSIWNSLSWKKKKILKMAEWFWIKIYTTEIYHNFQLHLGWTDFSAVFLLKNP